MLTNKQIEKEYNDNLHLIQHWFDSNKDNTALPKTVLFGLRELFTVEAQFIANMLHLQKAITILHSYASESEKKTINPYLKKLDELALRYERLHLIDILKTEATPEQVIYSLEQKYTSTDFRQLLGTLTELEGYKAEINQLYQKYEGSLTGYSLRYDETSAQKPTPLEIDKNGFILTKKGLFYVHPTAGLQKIPLKQFYNRSQLNALLGAQNQVFLTDTEVDNHILNNMKENSGFSLPIGSHTPFKKSLSRPSSLGSKQEQYQVLTDYTAMPWQKIGRFKLPLEVIVTSLQKDNNVAEEILSSTQKSLDAVTDLTQNFAQQKVGEILRPQEEADLSQKLAKKQHHQSIQEFSSKRSQQAYMLRQILDVHSSQQSPVNDFSTYLKTILTESYSDLFRLDNRGTLQLTLPVSDSRYKNILDAFGYSSDLIKGIKDSESEVRLDPSQFSPIKLATLYQQDRNPLWLVLKTLKPVSQSFTPEAKVKACLQAASVIRHHHENLRQENQSALVYQLALIALETANQHGNAKAQAMVADAIKPRPIVLEKINKVLPAFQNLGEWIIAQQQVVHPAKKIIPVKEFLNTTSNIPSSPTRQAIEDLTHFFNQFSDTNSRGIRTIQEYIENQTRKYDISDEEKLQKISNKMKSIATERKGRWLSKQTLFGNQNRMPAVDELYKHMAEKNFKISTPQDVQQLIQCVTGLPLVPGGKVVYSQNEGSFMTPPNR